MLKTVSIANLQASLNNSKELMNFYYRNIAIISCPASFLEIIYNDSSVGGIRNMVASIGAII